MLPALINFHKRVLLVFENRTMLFDLNKGFSLISRHMFPDPVIKVSQNSSTVVLTTEKEKYMIDMTSSDDVRLLTGSVFLESHRRLSDGYLFAEVSGSTVHERILGNKLSAASKYGDIRLSEMKGAYIAAEDALLLTHSDSQLYFWAPSNEFPAVQPDWEVYKQVDSLGTIKRAAIDDEGKTAVVLTASGILTTVPSEASDPANKLITDRCCDFVLYRNMLVFVEWDQVKSYDLENKETVRLFNL